MKLVLVQSLQAYLESSRASEELLSVLLLCPHPYKPKTNLKMPSTTMLSIMDNLTEEMNHVLIDIPSELIQRFSFAENDYDKMLYDLHCLHCGFNALFVCNLICL